MLNKVIIHGNLTRSPELRYAPQGKAVVNFSIANNQKYKDQNRAHFINCVAWGNTAENINKYFPKGRPILVEGRLEQRSWEDKDGKKRYAYEVIVERFDFVGGEAKQRKITEEEAGIDFSNAVEEGFKDESDT